jgi:hypothetical protein
MGTGLPGAGPAKRAQLGQVLRPTAARERAGAERERLRRVLQSPAAAIVGVLTALEERYGSVADYLRSAGVTDAELEFARARLRD